MKNSNDFRTFGEDYELIKQRDPSAQLLQDRGGNSMILVSPKYQGKVFTSSTNGLDGSSIGWVNEGAVRSDLIDPQMNAYGGENRLWIGPEGSKYSVFFEPGKELEFSNWSTPAGIDYESWKLDSANSEQVSMSHEMNVRNNAGFLFKVRIERMVTLLTHEGATKLLNVNLVNDIHFVAYSTKNVLRNIGSEAWTKDNGTICIWMLDMFSPSDETIIIVPHERIDEENSNAITTDYFGEISSERLQQKEGVIFFRADGNSRGKIGVRGAFAIPWAASYDPGNNMFTYVQFDVDPDAVYLNQEWNKEKDPFIGDAVNAYNDGPLEDGSQLGPFYELESCSPGAFLQPGEELLHKHNVYHFSGEEKDLDGLVYNLTGLTIKQITNSLLN